MLLVAWMVILHASIHGEIWTPPLDRQRALPCCLIPHKGHSTYMEGFTTAYYILYHKEEYILHVMYGETAAWVPVLLRIYSRIVMWKLQGDITVYMSYAFVMIIILP